MTRTISMLPEGIMLDILSRLCVQDLSPCRFVCKNWYHIIKDPVFVHSHHSRIDQDDPTFIVLHHEITAIPWDEKPFLVDNKSMSTQLKAKPLRTCSPFYLSGSLCIVGSSNGLLCLKYKLADRFYCIMNPITNKMLPLPKAPEIGGSGYRYSRSGPSGFAFDATSKTYKVVQSWWYARHENEESVLVFDSHTIGSGKWTRVHEISDADSREMMQSAVFVNNALHWQIQNQQFCDHICAIDVGAETFKTFKNPPEYNDTEYKSLGSIKACLSFLTEFHGDLLVWVMKDYGVEESWVKEYTVCLNRPLDFEYSWNWDGFTTLGTMKNGNTLFNDGKHLSYYDFEKKENQVINIHGLPSCESWGFPGAVAHVGSLVSPESIAAGEN